MSRHILISGGTQGIGLGCAKKFADQGDQVTLIGRTQEHLDQALIALPNARGYLFDVSNPSMVGEYVERIEQAHGAIDVLVNSAGSGRRAETLKLTHNDWMHSMQSKFFTYTNMLDAVLPRMAQRRSGSAINIIGYSGKGQIPNHVNGGAANAALMMATTGLAHEYARYSVRVNAVNPAGVETEHIQRYMRQEAEWRNTSYEHIRQEAVSKYPLGRLVTVEEVAATVVFLASSAAASICGAVIPIEGARNPLV